VREVKRTPIGTAALIVGVVAVLLAVLADELGVGGQSGFGWKQGILLALGVASAVVGVALLTGASRRVVKEAIQPGPLDRPDEPPRPPADPGSGSFDRPGEPPRPPADRR
jgi:hypothetical protein